MTGECWPPAKTHIAVALGTIAWCLTGCAGVQSALDPAGPQAARISHLWWLMLADCSAVFILVLGVLLLAVFRPRRSDTPGGDPAARRRMIITVGGAVAATVVILFILLIASVSTVRLLSSLPAKEALTVEVTGHQWWWEIRYVNPSPSQQVVTANEIHIPVGRPVVFRLASHDVIHSLWVPNLHDKLDLIPGHTTTLRLQADR